MAFQIGQPGVSDFLESLLRNLDVVIKMGDDLFLPVNTELKEVKNLLLGFEDVLLDGEKRRQLGNKGAERWMDHLKDLFYDIDDLLHEVKMEKQQLDHEITGEPRGDSKVRYNYSAGFRTSENVKYRLGQVLDILRKLTEEANRLELKRDSVQNDATWLEYHAKFRPKQGCYADEAMIHGREGEKNEIIERLLNEDGGESKRNYEFVCVVGMGGLGKTTLSQLVYQEVKRFFDVTSWVCVSDVVNVTKVIEDLIESASGKGDPNMPSALPALQERLEAIIKDKKFLLVLDDVWTTKEWKELKGPLNFGVNGSKILVTTRLSEVAEDLDNKEPFRLGRLEHAHCLKIFNDNAFVDKDGIADDEDLMKMGHEIVNKCAGVPLVAKVIGSLLKREDKGKWKTLKDNDLWDLAYNDGDVYPGLRLSYFYLPPILKRCFEYFALFPSDFQFDQGELVRMWMAEGLIEGKEGEEAKEIGDQYYNDLKGRSLIEENDMMHDMVHHLASIVCGSSFFRDSNGSNSGTSSLQSVRHAVIQDKPELILDSGKLRTLNYNGYLSEELFSVERWRDFKLSTIGCDLRYLKLKCNFENSTLPDSICTLTNLQVLDLSFCLDLKILPPDLGNLLNLWFLGLECTGIIGLPDSVCHLSNLRVLDLSFCTSLTTLPNDVGNLPSLHELMLHWSSISSLPESIVNATNLRVLGISDSVTLPANIGKLTKLEQLNFYEVGKEKGRGIDELKGMDRLKGRLTIENMENIGSAEEAFMANLRSKKHIEELEFSWKDFNAALRGRDGGMEVRVMEALKTNAAIKSLFFENNVGHKFPSWMKTALRRRYGEMELREMEVRVMEALVPIAAIKSLFLENNVGNKFTFWMNTHLIRRYGEMEVRVMEALEPNASIKSLFLENNVGHKFSSRMKTALRVGDRVMEALLPNAVRVMEALEPNPAIKSLSFKNYVGHKFPSWMKTAPLHNLTQLSLTNLPATSEMTGMDFKSLRVLELYNCPALRKVKMSTPKLERLVVIKCKGLKLASLVLASLFWDTLETLGCDYCHLHHFLQQLKSTNATACTKLKELTVSVGGDNGITSLLVGWPSILTSLKVLELQDLPPSNFKILSKEDESCRVSPSELLVSISKLTIRDCPDLVSLESLELPSRLRVLYILNCPNLKNLPCGLRHLTSLQTIWILNCPVLEIRPHHPLPSSIRHKFIRNCPKLEEQRVMEEKEEWKGVFGLI